MPSSHMGFHEIICHHIDASLLNVGNLSSVVTINDET